MKSKLPLLLLLLLISLSGMKCEKEEFNKKEELPAETQSGKRTFGCLVNGKVWLPRSNFPYSSLTSSFGNQIFDIVARQGNISDIGFTIRDFTDVGTYVITGDRIHASFRSYETEYLAYEGAIIIKKCDVINRIMAGRFSFKGKSEAGEEIEITDGRFDVIYP